MLQGSEERRTLYIKNLNERIPHKQLRVKLEEKCSQYGGIAKIYTSRGIRKRGQAFVAFHKSEDAENALDSLQNLVMYEKPLQVAFSRTPSDMHVSVETIESRRQDRVSHHQSTRKVPSKPLETGENTQGPPGVSKESESVPTFNKPVSFGEPHNVLLLQQIPESVSTPDLQSKFGEFPGFVEARMFAVKHVGFLEFESVTAAEGAIARVAESGVGNVSYAKK